MNILSLYARTGNEPESIDFENMWSKCHEETEKEPLTKEQILAITDRNNPSCPFYDRIGQDRVVDQLLPIIVTTLSGQIHSTALLFTGPASTGKTDFAKRFANSVQLPFIQTDAKTVKGTETIFQLAIAALKEKHQPISPIGIVSGKEKYKLPPMVIFIDEIHGLTPSVMDALLKSLESSDATLITQEVVVDCSNVIWIGATTERGSILARKPAFDSRFDKIEFSSYTVDEVTRILQLHFQWSYAECKALAIRSGCIVREAIAIGRKVDRQLALMKLRQDATVVAAIDKVSQQLGVDENGVTEHQLRVLQALRNHHPKGMTYGQLAKAINRTIEELKQAVLPGLLLDTEDHPSKVVWSGVTHITNNGIRYLEYHYDKNNTKK